MKDQELILEKITKENRQLGQIQQELEAIKLKNAELQKALFPPIAPLSPV
jgi:hypothetical protein